MSPAICISRNFEQLQVDLVQFLHWSLFEQVMFVCLFVFAGGSVGDGEQDGSLTSLTHNHQKGKFVIHSF